MDGSNIDSLRGGSIFGRGYLAQYKNHKMGRRMRLEKGCIMDGHTKEPRGDDMNTLEANAKLDVNDIVTSHHPDTKTGITNQDVCEFFGFSKGLDLELPGSMVMMLEGLVERGYWCRIETPIGNEGYFCLIIKKGELKGRVSAYALAAPKAVLEAVKQLIKEVREDECQSNDEV